MLLLGLLHGCKSCIEKERKALLELKKYIILRAEEGNSDFILNTWANDTKSNCCLWEGIECNQISGRIIKISTGKSSVVEDSVLDLSLLHPFEEVRSLDLSGDAIGFSDLFDDLEGYKSLSRLQNLEFLDFSANTFNNSIFPFLNAATSVKTFKELINLTSLEKLDLSGNNFNSCFIPVEERVALLDLKKFTIASNESHQLLTTWTNVTKSDCCQWEKVKCHRASGRVIRLSIGWVRYGESSLNISLLHPFEEVQILDLSSLGFSGLFDDVEGYKSLRRLRNLEILDLSGNAFNNSIFPFINAATSLTTLLLHWNNMDGLFPAKELKDLTNLELLDLSENRFNNSIPLGDLPALRNLKALDLHGNEFSTSVELQGKSA
ncbi:hypothetical protein F2Q70_00044605 [Brassica cretica]|uniref:Leucine-rich repeat-containing N-terminal plant-type domain-containing protein n=1 Tax=Brassica cretica TaxID=69181 RepID=A0A8S9KBX2_BRACR|nr:hypothetical protein F2Q70_00044605 [Brassica cretica]